eukprot:1568720-Rhodomonas_salina.1
MGSGGGVEISTGAGGLTEPRLSPQPAPAIPHGFDCPEFGRRRVTLRSLCGARRRVRRGLQLASAVERRRGLDAIRVRGAWLVGSELPVDAPAVELRGLARGAVD